MSNAKLAIVCLVCILTIAACTVAIGRGPSAAKWGQPGVQALWATGLICVTASVLGIIPLLLASLWFPSQVGPAALSATVIRLLGTAFMGAAYQVLFKPELKPFLFWVLVFYGLNLVIETTFSVLIVRRISSSLPATGGHG